MTGDWIQWSLQMMGPHTIDCFADTYNRQVPCFNSRFLSPGSEAVDAFTCNWGEETNWWCPPIHLITRVLQHARKTKAHGTLIVPCWHSAPFWPVLYPDGNRPTNFVQKVLELSQ